MKYEQTTDKLLSSRILKFSLISIFILFLTRLISLGMITWVMIIVDSLGSAEQYKADVFLKIAEVLNVPISGSLATITTAVVARYGLREVANNFNDKEKL